MWRGLWLACVCLGAQAQHRVEFTLDLSAEIAAQRFDPAHDQVGLRGATAPLSWSSTLPAHAVGAGRYGVTVEFAQDAAHGQPVAYKIKIDHPGGSPDAGWEACGNSGLLLDAAALKVERAFGTAVSAPVSRVGHLERLAALPSRFVAPRGLQVWLPPGYEAGGRERYPVLYLQDGQNVFDSAAAGAEWQVDEAAQAGVTSGRLAPFIVVAVDNTAERIHDYTPTAMRLSPGGPLQGGGAGAYSRYLIEELKPFIDAHYRTEPDARHTAVGGSSLGGLLSLWLAIHHADTFGAALVVSPSVWWDGAFALRDLGESRWPQASRPRLWLDVGGREGGDTLDDARHLRDALHAKGWGDGVLRYLEAPEGAHDEASWALRVPAMLEFLYGR
jgi:predicted alpha/beta superfamily hydrolase